MQINIIQKAYFIIEFFLLVWLSFSLHYALKLFLWCGQDFVAMWSVQMGIEATHHTVFKRISTSAPTQAIPETQQARENCFIFQKHFFILQIDTI